MLFYIFIDFQIEMNLQNQTHYRQKPKTLHLSVQHINRLLFPLIVTRIKSLTSFCPNYHQKKKRESKETYFLSSI